MYEYYCKKCNKKCDFDGEIELREGNYEGDWQEYHIDCNTKVIVTMKFC